MRKYLVATDGGELWIDSFTVAADAPHRDAAYAFLDYIPQPEKAAPWTRSSRLFPHANDAATALRQRRGPQQPGHLPARGIAGEARVRGQRRRYNSPERAETWARIKASS